MPELRKPDAVRPETPETRDAPGGQEGHRIPDTAANRISEIGAFPCVLRGAFTVYQRTVERHAPGARLFVVGRDLNSAQAGAKFSHVGAKGSAEDTRLSRRLSGVDVLVHGGTPDGVLREVANAMLLSRSRMPIQRLREVHQRLAAAVSALKKKAHAESIYTARLFNEVLVTARTIADEVVSTGQCC
jgi:hypothetical protein